MIAPRACPENLASPTLCRALLAAVAWLGGCADEPLVSTTAATEPATSGPTSFDPPPDDGPDAPTTGTPTTGAPTTGAPATSGSDGEGTAAATTGTLGPFCGDGMVDSDEECDDGDANGDQAYCTLACVLNYCGDGKLLAGHELCDAGAANSDEYGASCTSECEPGQRCGDHIVQAPHETCDLGPDNGGPVGDDQGVLCGADCRLQARRGFVTSATFTGDLGGVFVADARCRELAAAAGVPHADDYHAFLSTAEQSVADRFAPLLGEPLPYVTLNGHKFAQSFADLLLSGPSAPGISVTETGEILLNAWVLTDTAAPGGQTYADDLDCDGWTSAAAQLGARAGLSFPSDPSQAPAWQAEGWWTSFMNRACDAMYFHLYCLEL